MLNSFGVCCVLAAIISTDFDLVYKDKMTICTCITK